MNRNFLSGVVILACLCFINSKSYAWGYPPVARICGDCRNTDYICAGQQVDLDGHLSYDRDGEIEVWKWYIYKAVNAYGYYLKDTVYGEVKTYTFKDGGKYWIKLEVKDNDHYKDTDSCKFFVVDIDADVDRNDAINSYDENDEGTSYAIVLPNCDDDNGDGIPDNWIGNKDWDLYGEDEQASNVVDADPDKDDLAGLWVHQIPYAGWEVPRFLVVTLSIDEPVNDDDFFQDVPDIDRIRIFLPKEQNNWQIQAGDDAIIGPDTTNTYDITSIIKGNGIIKFGVEGIEFGAMVDITLTLQTDFCESSDTVQMRVAPFTLTNHSMGVSSSGKTVYVSNLGTYNSDLRTKLKNPNYYGSCVDEVGYYDYDIWHQDGYEVGYVEAPYGDTMPVFLVLPRAYFLEAILADYVHNDRLGSGVGVCWRLEEIQVGAGYNSGGNIECTLGGKVFYGTDLHDDIDNFFDAQGTNVNPFSITTNWLRVGHVDEIVSFAPSGYTIVADPDICWSLALWAYSENSSARIAGHNILYDILSVNHMYYLNVDPSPDQEWKEDNAGVMEPQNLPTSLGSWTSPEEDPEPGLNNTGNGVLTKGGAFVAYLPAGINTRTYWIKFDQGDNLHYSVRFKDDSGGYGNPDSDVYGMYYENGWHYGSGADYVRTDSDCIFKTAKCFIFAAWWDRDYRDQIEPDDEFFFTVNTNCTTLEMPVLFRQDVRSKQRFAVAYTINHVNCLVDGNTVFTGDPYDDSGTNRFKDYVEDLFNKAGYSDIVFADSIHYHNREGDIHCGTNVRRE